MTVTETLFLIQLRAFLTGQTEEHQSVDETVLSELLTLSAKHSVTPIIAETLFSCGLLQGNDAAEIYRQFSYKAVVQCEQQVAELSKMTDLFEQHKIANIPLKGSVLRRYYPEPWMRTSCDVDILIHEEELKTAIYLLENELGYRKDNMTNHDVMMIAPNGACFELHYDVDEAGFNLSEAWETAVLSKGRYQYELLPEFFIFHHLSHMAKHFVGGGCGIRFLVDLHLVEKNLDYDKEKLFAMLESCELHKFAKNIFDLLASWVNGQPFTKVQQKMIDFILRGGIYGNRDNRFAINHSRRRNLFVYVFFRIFPKMPSMVYLYPILRKYPILLPLCHFRRLLSLLRLKKFRNASEEMKGVTSLDEKALDEAHLFMQEVGLW